jgi:hypothetical protein
MGRVGHHDLPRFLNAINIARSINRRMRHFLVLIHSQQRPER